MNWKLLVLATLLFLTTRVAPVSLSATEDKGEGAVKRIDAVAPMQWKPPTVTAQENDVLEWHVTSGTHGVIFTDWAKAKEVLKVDEKESLKIEKQMGFPDPAQGTKSVSKTDLGGKTLMVRATVQKIPAGMDEIPFICTVHGKNMAGKVILQAKKEVKKIEAVAPMQWKPPTITVQQGDTVEFHVTSGTHGVIFTDWTKAKEVLKVDEKESLKIEKQTGFADPAQGTKGVSNKDLGGKTLMVRATVQKIPAGMDEIPFICTVHGKGMSGKLLLK